MKNTGYPRQLTRRTAALAGVAFLVAAAATAVVTVRSARDSRQFQNRLAEAELETGRLTADHTTLIAAQAHANLAADPTATLSWLKELPADFEDPSVPAIVADSLSRGVARDVYEVEAATMALFADTAGTIVAVGRDRLATVDPNTKRPTVAASDQFFTVAAFSAAAGEVAAARADGGAVLFDIGSGASSAHTVATPTEVTALTYSPSGTRLALGLDDGRLALRGRSEDTELLTVPGTGPVTALAFLDEARLVYTRKDATLVVVDSASGDITREIALAQPAAGIAVGGSGTLLAAYDRAGNVVVLESGLRESRFQSPRTPLRQVVVDPTGRSLFLVGDREATLQPWPPGGATSTLTPAGERGSAVVFAPTGDRLAVVRDGIHIEEWHLERLPQRTIPHLARTLRGHAAPITALQYTPDGAGLLSADRAGTVRLWPGKAPFATAGDHRRVQFRSDCRAWVSLSRQGLLRYHEPEAVPPTRALLASADIDSAVDATSVHAEPTTVAAALSTGSVRLWNVDAWRHMDLVGAPAENLRIRHSHDGEQIGVASGDGSLLLWPTSGGTPQRIQVAEQPVTDFDYANGRPLAWALADGALFRIDTAEATAEALSAPAAIATADFDSAGGILAGDSLGALFAYDLGKAEARHLGRHPTAVSVVRAAGGRIISGSTVGTVRVEGDGDRSGRAFADHTGTVTAVDFVDGVVISGGTDGLVYLRDSDGDGVRVLRPGAAVTALCSDGHSLRVADVAGRVRRWDRSGKALVTTANWRQVVAGATSAEIDRTAAFRPGPATPPSPAPSQTEKPTL